MKNVIKLGLFGTAALALALFCTQSNHYWQQNCSDYVCDSHGHARISAQEIWDGGFNWNTKANDLHVVQAQPRFEDILPGSIQEGDVLAFHGAHVAWFHNGQWMDSDPKHNGPGVMQYDSQDLWFAGPVRILRWNQ